MALPQSALSELLEAFRAGEGVDLIRDSVRVALQELIELEATERIGAAPYQRSEDRTTERNGHRPRILTTKAGDVELKIPKLRKGSFLPIILEPRRRIDQALYAVVMEAYVHGISTRSVDDLVEAMGGTGVSKSEVSRICAGLDESVGAFRTRALDHVAFPYVYLDASYLHVRNTPGKGGQVVSMAVVVATGVTAGGQREILGLDVGDSEDEVFWRAFLLSLKQRGLGGVRLVISDQHSGLVKALGWAFQGVAHQRCRVHFARNLLAHVPKGQAELVATAFRMIFAQPTAEDVHAAWDKTRDELADTSRHVRRLPALGESGSWDVQASTPRSFGSERCGWSRRSGRTIRRSGPRSVRSPASSGSGRRRLCGPGSGVTRSTPATVLG